MKRLALLAAAATVAALGLTQAALAEDARETAPAAATAVEPAPELDASVVDPAPSYFEASADPTCEDYGFFAADKRGECDKACKKGNKCQKKQVCGDYQCPPPGYCWKCPN